MVYAIQGSGPSCSMRRVIGAFAGLLLGLCAGAALLRAEAAPSGPPMPVASDARLAGDQNRTRFVVDLDHAVDVSVFLLADPARVIVDLPEIAFRFGPNVGKEGRGLINAFRYGQFAAGKSRIVLDAREPLLVERSFVVPPTDGQPARLVIDLVKASREEFQRAVERDARTLQRPRTTSLNVARPLPGEPTRSELPLVVLDPGHGGLDAGASAPDGTPEKTITLDIARLVKTVLEASGKVRVLMTRDSDSFVSLPERVRFARERQAALFLSLHADSLARNPFGAAAVQGASIYTLSETASDQEAAAYAERENKSDQIAGVELPPDTNDVADILFDLMHRETKNFSVHFAKLLVDDLKPEVKLVRNPHRFAGFRVLRAPDVPSALLELGYLSSKDDVRLLMTSEWRDKVAARIAHAILTFVATSQVRSATTGATP